MAVDSNKMQLHQDVIMIGLFRSDQLLSSSTIAMAKEFSKNQRVFYVDRPYSFKDIWNERKNSSVKKRYTFWGKRKRKFIEVKSEEGNFISIVAPATLPIAFLPPGKLYQLLNNLNNYLISKSIQECIKEYGIKDYIFINSFLPGFPGLMPHWVQPQPLVNFYQTLDEITQEPYIAKHGTAAELKAMNDTDIGIASSTALANKYRLLTGKDIKVVSNAADFSLFEKAKNLPLEIPEDLANITEPRIIYTGHYSDLRFDHELVNKMAERFKNINFVFVGSYEEQHVINHGLKKYNNIHFLGLRPITKLPAYLKYCKAAIIPYAKNELTAKIYPLKVNEYLAAGIPVITSNFSEDMPQFADVAYLANNHEEFLNGIDVAINENNNEQLLTKRVEVAKQNSWSKRIEHINQLSSEFIAKKDKNGYDVIMIGLVRCDNLISSATLSWAKEFSKTNRVFYIDRPFSIKDILTEAFHPLVKDKVLKAVFRINPYKRKIFPNTHYLSITTPVSLPINFLPHGKLFNWFNRYNQHLIYKTIQKVINDHEIKNYIFIESFFPNLSLQFPDYINPKPLVTVYQSLDEISQEKYIAQHGIDLEPKAIKDCTIPMVTSKGLSKKYKEITGRNIPVIANAVDLELFERAKVKRYEKPEIIKDIQKPIILYTGHYSNLRFDNELLVKLSHEFNQYALVFVGTFNAKAAKELIDKGSGNIYFKGYLPISELGAVIYHSKIAIIPYIANELTSNIYPLKINEYLAAGIPCVTTNFSEDLAEFNEFVYIAQTHEEFIEKIKSGLSEDINTKLEGRIAIAKNNTWRARINQLEALIKDYLKHGVKP